MQDTIVVGQRYICDAEPDLGLGIVTGVEGRRLEIHFPAADTTRQYALANSPLSRIRFDTGDEIEDRDGRLHTVLSSRDIDSLQFYRIADPEQDPESWLPETALSPRLSLSQPLKRLLAGQCETAAWFRLRRSALQALEHIESSTLLGLCSGRTELLPHQLYIASEVASRPAPRVLLSDEVGLGKTIEACLILQQQLFSGLAGRVLIIVPDSLLHQWLVELLRRFNLHFTIMDRERCEAVAEHSEDNPFDGEQLVLCSRDFLLEQEKWRAQALASGWDLLILDEAHHLLGSAAQAPDSVLYSLAQDFAAKVPGLLLLTATPDQEGLASHFALLQLLDPHRFHDFDSFVQEQQQYHAVAELLDPLLRYAELEAGPRAALLNRLRSYAADRELQNLLERLENAEPSLLDAAARRVLQALLDRHGTGRIVFRNTRRHISGFPARELQLQRFALPALYQEQPQCLYPEHEHTGSDAWLKSDPRVGWIEQQLKTYRDDKFLLICHYRETAEALENFLRLQRGIRSAVFHEGMSLLERDRAAAYFAETEGGARLLVCSEIGSEGRNFQFTHQLLLFDLPDNPDLLEQRIGRLDRIGQQRAVQLHLPCFDNSAQAVLLQLYAEVFRIFEAPNPVASHVCETLQDSLGQALEHPADAAQLDSLLLQAGELNARELQLHQQGRDRLLELNSCRPEQAATLLRQIREQEQQQSPEGLLQQIFSAFGLDFDQNSNATWSVRAGDDMLIEHFPQIPDAGLSFTLDRELALVREDLPFVNWLHPLVLQGLDLVLQQHQGKAVAGILRDKRLPSGTLVLEALCRVTLSAPPRLQAGRWFPTTTLRAVVDSQKRSIGKSLSGEFLDSRCSMLDKARILALVADGRKSIELLHRLALQVAEKQLAALVEERDARMRSDLDAEIERLQALQAVNPQVQQGEIDYLMEQRRQLAESFAQARVQPAALRLLVVL